MSAFSADRQATLIIFFCIVSLVFTACGVEAESDELPLASPETASTATVGSITAEKPGSTPPGTIIPTRQPSPTYTPLQVATATAGRPGLEDLVVDKTGFSNATGQLMYAFEINNPNEFTLVDSVYRLSILDENGLSLGNETGRLPLILPGQQLGVAASTSMENVDDVADIQLMVTGGDPITLDTLPGLSVLDINFRPSEIYDQVYGLIGNEGVRDLEDIRVSAIAYDANEDIIGAGYAFLSFLPAGESAGVSIALSTAGQVDHVIIFPRASLASLLQSSPNRPPFTAGMVLLDQGFSQSDIEISYGILVDNPNISYSLLDAEYRVTFMNRAGQVIAVDEGYIDLLLPQQTWGIGDRVFVEEGDRVATMHMLTSVSKYRPTLFKPALEIENVAIITGTQEIRVTADLISPYQRTINEVRLSALVYNSAGRIIGGGLEWTNNVPPGVITPVEVRVSAAEPVITANLYAGLTRIISE